MEPLKELQPGTYLLKDLVLGIFDGPRRIQFIKSGTPYIRLGDIEMGEIYIDPQQNIAPSNLDHRFYLQHDDVLVNKTGDDPRAVAVQDKIRGAITSPDIYCLRVNPGIISPVWVANYLNTSYGKRLLRERSSGTTLRRLHMVDLEQLPVVVPNKNIIQEIELLEKQASQHAQAANELFEQTIHGMYAEINDRCEIHSDATEFPQELTPSILDNAKFFRRLGEVAEIAVASRKMLKPDQQVKYVQTSDIDQQSFLFHRVRSANAQDLPSRIRLPLRSLQVLLLASGSNLGTPSHPVAIVDPTLDGAYASNTFLALEFRETPIYFGIVLKHPIVLNQLHRIASGAVVTTLRKKDVINLQIPVLSIVWRQDFNDRAQLAWERRSLALALRRQALEKADNYIQQTIGEHKIDN